MTDALARLNSLPDEAAAAELLKCCGATRWARQMAGRRPFADERELLEAADLVWWRLGREDWLEAFRSHPKIGERKAERETGGEARRWSEDEQRAASDAGADVLDALRDANRGYEERFGHIFIVSATGKRADEMLALLVRRLSNEQETELCVAAEEQRRITRLRLRKLLSESPESGV